MTTVRNSVIWGAIVGVALGVTITFGLARGMLPMPWRADVPVEPQRSTVLDLESLSSIAPVIRTGPAIEPRRVARPAALGERPGDASLAAAVPATTTGDQARRAVETGLERGLSRS